jgi:hypothetical protein
MHVNVPTSGLKVGDVIQGTGRFYVVTRTYASAEDMPKASVLCSDGSTSSWTDAPGSMSGFHLRVAEGCEPTIEALKLVVGRLKS